MTTTHDNSSPVVSHPSLWMAVIIAIIVGLFAGPRLASWWQPDDLTTARKLLEQGHADDALMAFRRHLLRSPDDHTTRLALGMILEQRDPDAALREFRQIPLTAPEFTSAARHVAKLSLELGRDYDAIGPLEFLQEQDPKDAGFQQTLAEIYFRRQDFEKSLMHARRLLELKPDSIDAYLMIAESSDSLKHTVDMIAPLEAALRLNNDLPQAHLNLAFAYEAADRPDEAMPHVRWFLERYPTSVAAHRILASVERSRGNFEEALSAALAGRKLSPKNLELAILAAELQLYLSQPENAHETLSELAIDFPRERRLLIPLLRAAVLCKKTEQADEIQKLLRQIETKE